MVDEEVGTNPIHLIRSWNRSTSQWVLAWVSKLNHFLGKWGVDGNRRYPCSVHGYPDSMLGMLGMLGGRCVGGWCNVGCPGGREWMFRSGEAQIALHETPSPPLFTGVFSYVCAQLYGRLAVGRTGAWWLVRVDAAKSAAQQDAQIPICNATTLFLLSSNHPLPSNRYAAAH